MSLFDEPSDSVEQALYAVSERYSYITREHANKVMFLLDRHHRQEHGEPLTDAEYTKTLSVMKYGTGETVRSEDIDSAYERFIEDGASERLYGVLDSGPLESSSADVLTEPPEDAATDEHVASYVETVFDELFPELEAVDERLYEQDDFRDATFLTRLEP